MIYNALKYLHIVSAMVGVGATFTYSMWFALGRRQTEKMGFVLQGVKMVDSWMATPAFVSAGLSGAALVYVSGRAWTSLWIWLSLSLYAAATFIALSLASPLLDRQMALFAAKGGEDAEFQAVAMKSKRLGPLLGLMTFAIVYLMIFKPE